MHVTCDGVGTDDGIQGLSNERPTIVHVPSIDAGMDDGRKSEERSATGTDQRNKGDLHDYGT
jgi:hypothetical protein